MGYNRRKFLKKLGLGSASVLFYPALSGSKSAEKPNFVFILLDDLGYGDLGCYGNPFNETPHIDQLAADGIRFTQAYAAAPNCSPTRASILTGQYPARVGITQYLPGNRNFDRFQKKKLLQPKLPEGLPVDTTTIAEALQPHGYTSALFGKWHLGPDEHAPGNAGFDRVIHGGPWGNQDQMFAPYGLGYDSAEKGEYLTDFLTDNALSFIESQQENPFFLYLPYHSVHAPIGGKPELVKKYRKKNKKMDGDFNPEYAAMLEGVDQNVGRIRRRLRELGLAENTHIVFFSDNGGSENKGADNGPFRKGKGWLYEGGIRVPYIAAGYGVTQRNTPNREMVFSTDFLPTFLDYAGAPLPNDYPGDGISVKETLTGGASIARDTLFWHYPHYSWAGSPPSSAIRKGNLKLIQFLENDELELYNLEKDPDESNNLAYKHPEKAKALLNELKSWRRRVDAKMPDPNPDYEGK